MWFSGSGDTTVSGYRLTDGTSHLWSVGFNGPAPGTPTIIGETVVGGSDTGTITGTPLRSYALEPPDGRLTRTPTPEPDATPTPHVDMVPPEPRWNRILDGPVGPLGFGDGFLYVGSGWTVVSLTVDGQIRWRASVGGHVSGPPATAEDTVYVSRADGTVLGLATADGHEHWQTTVGAAATLPAIGRHDADIRAVIGTPTGVVALDGSQGQTAWSRDMEHVRGSPAITQDAVVVGDAAGTVRCLGLHDGSDRWDRSLSRGVNGAPAIGGDVAYLGCRDSHLYAISLSEGATEWAIQLPDLVDGSPAVAYGAVFVVDQSGFLSMIVGDD